MDTLLNRYGSPLRSNDVVEGGFLEGDEKKNQIQNKSKNDESPNPDTTKEKEPLTNKSKEIVKESQIKITSRESYRRRNFDAKIFNILHPTSYFPKTNPSGKFLDIKSPERIPGKMPLDDFIQIPSSKSYYQRLIKSRKNKEVEKSSTPELLKITEETETTYIFKEATPFQIEMLDIHNKLRGHHNSPYLTLDKDMCAYAQQCAENLAKNSIMKYSLGPQGENLFSINKLKRKTEAIEACECWYKENLKYKYDEPKYPLCFQYGHFTQMIWAQSKLLGVGIAKARDKTYIVAHYIPQGNQHGEFKANVFKPKSKLRSRFFT